MTTLTFDTLKYTERLRSVGVTETQAKAEAEALRDALSEALDTSLATKSDIRDVRSDLLAVKTTVSLLDAKVEAKFDKLQWMVGIVIC